MVQQSHINCRRVAPGAGVPPEIGPSLPKLARIRQMLGGIGRKWPSWARVRPIKSKVGQHLTNVGRTWSILAEIWPMSANVNRSSAPKLTTWRSRAIVPLRFEATGLVASPLLMERNGEALKAFVHVLQGRVGLSEFQHRRAHTLTAALKVFRLGTELSTRNFVLEHVVSKSCNDLGVYGPDVSESCNDRILVTALGFGLEESKFRARLEAVAHAMYCTQTMRRALAYTSGTPPPIPES